MATFSELVSFQWEAGNAIAGAERMLAKVRDLQEGFALITASAAKAGDSISVSLEGTKRSFDMVSNYAANTAQNMVISFTEASATIKRQLEAIQQSVPNLRMTGPGQVQYGDDVGGKVSYTPEQLRWEAERRASQIINRSEARSPGLRTFGTSDLDVLAENPEAGRGRLQPSEFAVQKMMEKVLLEAQSKNIQIEEAMQAAAQRSAVLAQAEQTRGFTPVPGGGAFGRPPMAYGMDFIPGMTGPGGMNPAMFQAYLDAQRLGAQGRAEQQVPPIPERRFTPYSESTDIRRIYDLPFGAQTPTSTSTQDLQTRVTQEFDYLSESLRTAKTVSTQYNRWGEAVSRKVVQVEQSLQGGMGDEQKWVKSSAPTIEYSQQLMASQQLQAQMGQEQAFRAMQRDAYNRGDSNIPLQNLQMQQRAQYEQQLAAEKQVAYDDYMRQRQMMMAQQQQAAQTPFEAGFSTNTANQMAYASQLQDLQRQMSQAGTRLSVATAGGDPERIAAARRELDGLAKSYNSVKSEADEAAGKAGLMNNQLARHASWVLQGLAISAVFAGIAAGIKTAFDRAVDFQVALDRISTITGQMQPGATASLMSQYTGMAQYGVSTQDAGYGMIVGAQAGASRQMMTNAAQISEMFGDPKAYTNVVQELIQTQAFADAANMKNVDTLNYLATAYATVPSNAKDAAQAIEMYFNALQYGISLSRQLGQQPEQLALSLGRISMQAGLNDPKAVATQVESMMKNLANPNKQADFAQYGIGGATDPERIRSAIAAIRQLEAAGNTEGVQRVMTMLLGGSPMSNAQLITAKVVITGLGEALDSTGQNLKSFDEIHAKMADNFIASTNRMKSGWDVFLASLTATPTSPLGWVDEFVNNAGDNLRLAGLRNTGQSLFGSLDKGTQEQYIKEYNALAGGMGGFGVIKNDYQGNVMASPGTKTFEQGGWNDWFSQQINNGTASRAFQSAFYSWVTDKVANQNLPDTGGEMRGDRDRPMFIPPPAEPQALSPTSFFNLPKGMSMESFMALYGKEEAKLKEIPGITDEMLNIKPLAIMGDKAGETGKWLDTLSLSAVAASNALKDIGKGVEYGGIQQLPENISFDELFAKTKEMEGRLAKPVGEGGIGFENMGKWQQFMMYDPLEKTFKPLTTTSDALRMSIDELTKVEKQKITGIFNVPAQGEFLVPFFALQQGFVPSDRLNQGGGAGDGVTPAVQPVNNLANAATSAAQALWTISRGPGTQFDYHNRDTGNAASDYVAANRMRRPEKDDVYVPAVRKPTDFMSYPHPSPQIEASGVTGGTTVTIQTRNVIQIDGRVVATSVVDKFARDLYSVRRASPSSGGRAHMMM